MENDLFQKIYSYPTLKHSELHKIKEAHTKINFSKGDYFLESGQIANAYYLIEKGLLRSYVYDYQGNQITTGFCTSGEILIEVSSLFQRIPSEENMVALTKGNAWKIEFDVFQELFHSIEGLPEWGRAWMSQQLFFSKQHALDMLTKSATDRYLRMLNERPQVIQQAPLKHIASYLGITDSSLSRIRKEIYNS